MGKFNNYSTYRGSFYMTYREAIKMAKNISAYPNIWQLLLCKRPMPIFSWSNRNSWTNRSSRRNRSNRSRGRSNRPNRRYRPNGANRRYRSSGRSRSHRTNGTQPELQAWQETQVQRGRQEIPELQA